MKPTSVFYTLVLPSKFVFSRCRVYLWRDYDKAALRTDTHLKSYSVPPVPKTVFKLHCAFLEQNFAQISVIIRLVTVQQSLFKIHCNLPYSQHCEKINQIHLPLCISIASILGQSDASSFPSQQRKREPDGDLFLCPVKQWMWQHLSNQWSRTGKHN